MNNRGITYTEMMVSLFLSSMIVLSIGAVSSIGKNSNHRLIRESSVFTDITYGFKLLQNRFRESKSYQVIVATGAWQSDRIVVNNGAISEAFGLYQAAGTNIVDFVYLPNSNVENVREVIFSVPNPGTVTLNITQGVDSVSLTMFGNKGNVPFNISMDVQERS